MSEMNQNTQNAGDVTETTEELHRRVVTEMEETPEPETPLSAESQSSVIVDRSSQAMRAPIVAPAPEVRVFHHAARPQSPIARVAATSRSGEETPTVERDEKTVRITRRIDAPTRIMVKEEEHAQGTAGSPASVSAEQVNITFREESAPEETVVVVEQPAVTETLSAVPAEPLHRASTDVIVETIPAQRDSDLVLVSMPAKDRTYIEETPREAIVYTPASPKQVTELEVVTLASPHAQDTHIEYTRSEETGVEIPDSPYGRDLDFEKEIHREMKRIIDFCEDRLDYCVYETHEVEYFNYQDVIRALKEVWIFRNTDKSVMERQRSNLEQSLHMYVRAVRARGGNYVAPESHSIRWMHKRWMEMEQAEHIFEKRLSERLTSFYEGRYYSSVLVTLIWLVGVIFCCTGIQRFYFREWRFGSCLLWFSPLVQGTLAITVYWWIGFVTCGLGWCLMCCLCPTPCVTLFNCFDVFIVNYMVHAKNREIRPKGSHGTIESARMAFDKEDSHRVMVATVGRPEEQHELYDHIPLQTHFT